jgi:putative ABC transport system substrate-binding protein
MRRRDVIFLMCTAMLRPVPSYAQQKKVPRIGVLWHAANAEQEDVYLSILRKSFSDLGYVEGKTVELEHRFPAERLDLFRAFAKELVESKVDVIVAVTGLGAKQVKQASSTIPVVMVVEPDPIGNGLIQSLAHPGGNVTGLSLMMIDLSGKRLALLKEMVPNLASVALLTDPGDPSAPRAISSYGPTAQALGLSVQPFQAATPEAIDQAFVAIAQQNMGAVVVGPSSMFFNERARIGSLALANKLPTMVGSAEMMPFGPLLSYGPDFLDFFRRAVGYVDKILKGAKPSDLPVEQPTRFKMVVNLKSAKALGLKAPPSLVATADEVIE